ncbi:protocatechuate 3,4-dioxygenase subunit alpha [Leifsonia sp. PS1209]|uniref:protocatechuate 3,4-dioxygenase subunit alpha n=1 Tax=Leifsonia sp. PS1209 TaxID=2724914 RepID=UPI001442DA38|nr:protocatechuate 3,4-dioxygenase subunit alpha [Leifsonia sp. PS1209]QIZ98929.1 protocatechuate 3,4-dioxygenase subunit alpha [Leifsonia sp. PS1209]
MSTALAPTPGQTVGPFYGYALPFAGDSELTPPGAAGTIRLHGTVTDGAGVPVQDAILELWQADEHGAVPRATGSLRRDGHTFTGWGRAATDDDGHYTFSTRTPGPTEQGAPAFFAVLVFARGLLDKLHTRAYLPDDETALAADAFLAALPEDRRGTLIAEREPDGSLLFDIRLQGDDETVFIDFGGDRR